MCELLGVFPLQLAVTFPKVKWKVKIGFFPPLVSFSLLNTKTQVFEKQRPWELYNDSDGLSKDRLFLFFEDFSKIFFFFGLRFDFKVSLCFRYTGPTITTTSLLP